MSEQARERALKDAQILCVRAALTPWVLDLSDAPAERDPRVYFIRAGMSGPIKIGKADNPEARLASLQVGSPERLRLIGSIPGGIDLEHTLHAQFRADRIHGEWFKPSPSLLSYIREVIA